MKKPWGALIVLWLCVAVIAAVYTPGVHISAVYDEQMDDMTRIMIDDDQAEAEREAAVLKAEEVREEAKRLSNEGIWWYDTECETAQPIKDDEIGMNLMWGSYRVTIQYTAQESVRIRPVSARFQPFIKEQNPDAEMPAAPEGGTYTFEFEVTDSAEQVMLAVSEPVQVTRVEVEKIHALPVEPDLAAGCVGAGCVLSVLLMLGYDRTQRGRRRRRAAAVIVGAALFAGLPALMRGGIPAIGHDLTFHINRIEGIASALRSGQFPVRIHTSTLWGYGYAASEFYPELFLYIPALMRNAGVSQAMCLMMMQMGINLLAGCTAYISVRRLIRDEAAALGATVLYMLCNYRMANLYIRASIGESLAMIFFPLLVWGAYEVLMRDMRRWPVLAFAMWGIFSSHLLSTLFAVGFCALAGVVCLLRLIAQPKRIAAVLKAAAVTVVCSLWFIVPMLDYMRAGIDTNLMMDVSTHVLTPGSMFVGYLADDAPNEMYAWTVGVVPGLTMMLGCALYLLQRYTGTQRTEAMCEQDRVAMPLLILGGLALAATTTIFPWEKLSTMRQPISSLVRQIQFPWRLVGAAVVLLSIPAALGFLRTAAKPKQALMLLACMNIALSGQMLQRIAQQSDYLMPGDFYGTQIIQYEYMYLHTHKQALEPAYCRIPQHDGTMITDYKLERSGTKADITVCLPEGAMYIQAPLLYYPGYDATVNGEPCEVIRGANNVVRVLTDIRSEEPVKIRIRYKEPLSWRAAEAVSLAGMLTAAVMTMRRRRKRA